MSWRVARSLETLRDQINEAFPDRNKASDGTIGDADHQNRASDHNPWCGPGVVTAMDITHDPAKGVDIDKLTDELQASRDPRIKYVIANSLIMSGAGGPYPWTWQPYNGSNPHTAHFHLSVNCGAGMDDTRKWDLPSLAGQTREEVDMPLTQDEVQRIARASATELLRRDVIDNPYDNPDNKHWTVANTWAHIAARTVSADQTVTGLRAAVEKLADAVAKNDPLTARELKDAVAAAIKENVVSVDVTVQGKE